MIEKNFPHIRAAGPPRQRGVQYGKGVADRIQRNKEIYGSFYSYYTSMRWEQVVEQAREYIPAIEKYRPRFLEEMEGIAEGAGLAFEDVLVLNLRTEILNAAYARLAAQECTAVALLPEITVDERILLAQNWDWRPEVAETVCVLEIEADDIPNLVTVVEAGMLAKTGMNAAGLGVVTNALTSSLDCGEPGVPYHAILRAILESTTFSDAVNAVTLQRRASSANYLIAHEDGEAINVEAVPGGYDLTFFQYPDDGFMVHTNHFLERHAEFKDVGLFHGTGTLARWMRMRHLLQVQERPLNAFDLQELFSDHFNTPRSICAHPDVAFPPPEQVRTVASIIMDLEKREMWLADGNPCSTPYHRLQYRPLLG
jgi:isopenicillin-N N-acyltransferase-like protein